MAGRFELLCKLLVNLCADIFVFLPEVHNAPKEPEADLEAESSCGLRRTWLRRLMASFMPPLLFFAVWGVATMDVDDRLFPCLFWAWYDALCFDMLFPRVFAVRCCRKQSSVAAAWTGGGHIAAAPLFTVAMLTGVLLDVELPALQELALLWYAFLMLAFPLRVFVFVKLQPDNLLLRRTLLAARSLWHALLIMLEQLLLAISLRSETGMKAPLLLPLAAASAMEFLNLDRCDSSPLWLCPFLVTKCFSSLPALLGSSRFLAVVLLAPSIVRSALSLRAFAAQRRSLARRVPSSLCSSCGGSLRRAADLVSVHMEQVMTTEHVARVDPQELRKAVRLLDERYARGQQDHDAEAMQTALGLLLLDALGCTEAATSSAEELRLLGLALQQQRRQQKRSMAAAALPASSDLSSFSGAGTHPLAASQLSKISTAASLEDTAASPAQAMPRGLLLLSVVLREFNTGRRLEHARREGFLTTRQLLTAHMEQVRTTEHVARLDPNELRLAVQLLQEDYLLEELGTAPAPRNKVRLRLRLRHGQHMCCEDVEAGQAALDLLLLDALGKVGEQAPSLSRRAPSLTPCQEEPSPVAAEEERVVVEAGTCAEVAGRRSCVVPLGRAVPSVILHELNTGRPLSEARREGFQNTRQLLTRHMESVKAPEYMPRAGISSLQLLAATRLLEENYLLEEAPFPGSSPWPMDRLQLRLSLRSGGEMQRKDIDAAQEALDLLLLDALGRGGRRFRKPQLKLMAVLSPEPTAMPDRAVRACYIETAERKIRPGRPVSSVVLQDVSLVLEELGVTSTQQLLSAHVEQVRATEHVARVDPEELRAAMQYLTEDCRLEEPACPLQLRVSLQSEVPMDAQDIGRALEALDILIFDALGWGVELEVAGPVLEPPPLSPREEDFTPPPLGTLPLAAAQLSWSGPPLPPVESPPR